MTKRAMSREEIICLLELISEYSVLTNKNTNATTNKLKEAAWISLTDAFNSNYARYPKLKEQLKLKWDNLKKAARKRKHLIRLNRLKVQTGSGKIDYIPEDEVLEKVEYLMGDTSPSPSLQLQKNNRLRTTARAEIPIISLKDCADAKFQEPIGEDLHKCQNEEKNGVMSPVTQFKEEDPLQPKFLYRMPIENQNKGKTKWPNDGRREKNLAIAKYFEKKSEKIDLEITLLRMEIESMKRNDY